MKSFMIDAGREALECISYCVLELSKGYCATIWKFAKRS